ncbi:hypothetical protein Pmani_016356 [Petrolisthes manimaculis]|uniref:Reverse transcriptase domain-containing protein n=1 Tax=Petrolisthes manimaculis TaxID=1843537 RepID=A0AAE1PQ98_9EUCA|nr:hypothetical protein Pmani_016356 [Petrolisthes manimaculis]
MDVLVVEVTKEAPWCMLFADDIILVSESSEELQEKVELWRGLLEDYGLKVSRQKTEYLECNVAQGGDLFMQDHKLPKDHSLAPLPRQLPPPQRVLPPPRQQSWQDHHICSYHQWFGSQIRNPRLPCRWAAPTGPVSTRRNQGKK